jgi:FdrA protein
MVVRSRRLGPVYSNTPLQPGWELPGPANAHICIDAGEEEFTASRPHPMIDPDARIPLMRDALAGDTTAVLLFDVVLGYGAAPDPAATFAPFVSGADVAVVAHVVGTAADPQDLGAQEATLREAGCLVAPTAARAALLAAAIAGRDSSIVEEVP